MENKVSEKVKLLEKLTECGFNVPGFIHVPAQKFADEDFDALKSFLDRHQESYKVIARSAHPLESFFKGGTFDSLDTYADIAGIKYARNKMIKLAKTSKRLSIQRQQVFNQAPQIDIDEMGVIVMPFITGSSVMAKKIGNHWEFGYTRNRSHKVESDPHITRTPHDRRFMQLSEDIQKALGFRCEIEYIVSTEGDIYVVQAKDISGIETLENRENELSVKLDGVRRIRKRRNYRERPVYVMNNKAFYIEVISRCEDYVHHSKQQDADLQVIIDYVSVYEEEMERFALTNQRFAVLGFSIQDARELYQIANHYLDEFPDAQKILSKVLHAHLYQIDIFLSEADTLIAKDKFRINLCSHDAYGIDTVRNPLWSVYWHVDRHQEVVREFKRLGFKTSDTVAIDIDTEGHPIVSRH